MAVVDVRNIKGEKVSEMELSDDVFNVEVKSAVLHDVVKMQLAKRRAGTACVKNRSDVKGSTRKLFRQKGTGRARRGDIKSPLLRGGGVVFGPHPRSYAYDLPKKVRQLALKMALSSKLKNNTLTILDDITLDGIKTKNFVAVMEALEARKALIVISEENRNLVLSARNVPGVKVLKAEGLNVYDILRYDDLLLVPSSVRSIEGRFAS
ncbi:50S ribosomal protein L4 [Desulfobotulus sp.]|jgi:large subunit ribosomal protein L4|uniref:50S ribosomal protein L4 n=1 Tax=Desulfobotulus sp. TaxID=1940337 RepID=UPI002A36E232|nr:50S ribosomal protein L4 [Desulfobotulus sp.]MDY0163620.1 50S ribosomal protein L4 [Desulfobotulus sp.]